MMLNTSPFRKTYSNANDHLWVSVTFRCNLHSSSYFNNYVYTYHGKRNVLWLKRLACVSIREVMGSNLKSTDRRDYSDC
jgi:hypothetical protein